MANEVSVGKDLGGKPLSPPPSSFSSTSRGSGTDILVYGRLLLRGASRPCPDLQRHEQSFDVSLQYFGGVMNYHMEKTVGGAPLRPTSVMAAMPAGATRWAGPPA